MVARVSERLLSSAEVAQLLGVSAASVKRWADAGVLPCVKTAGQHRRFAPEAIERFRSTRGVAAVAPAVDAAGLTDELLAGGEAPLVEAQLLGLRAELGSWWRVAAELGPAIEEIGARWARGDISVVEEHRASERLGRALARLCEWMPLSPSAPRCLLATATGDEHTLGLSLVELCLRERGWAAVWVGRSSPIGDVAEAVARFDIGLVALSASSWSKHGPTLARQAHAIARACSSFGAALVLGGSGAWPAHPPYGRVVRDFATFSELLASLAAV